MKKLVLYYSFTGNAKQYASNLAKESGADVAALVPRKAYSTVTAYSAGSLAAMRGKTVEIEPLPINWDDYDDITIVAPIWASRPAPAINSGIALLPEGKDITLVTVSKSGRGNTEQAEAAIRGRNCRVMSVKHITM